MIDLNVPNLDCQDPVELDEFGHHLQLLSRYARCKSMAMICRGCGQIGDALELEQVCDDAYGQLPLSWRW